MENIEAFGVAKRLAMEAREVMPNTAIGTFYSIGFGFALDELLGFYELFVNFPMIGDKCLDLESR